MSIYTHSDLNDLNITALLLDREGNNDDDDDDYGGHWEEEGW